MRYVVHLLVCLVALASSCSAVNAYTLTFDDVPAGTVLENSTLYTHGYGIHFLYGFETANHSSSIWGIPHSSPNVLIWTGGPDGARTNFGPYTPDGSTRQYVSSVTGYFSTEMDAVVKVTAYVRATPFSLAEVASVEIGGPGESWSNRFVEIASPGSRFDRLYFEGVGGSGLSGFCVDDMSIPEPSSLLALLAGLGGLGGAMWRRRR